MTTTRDTAPLKWGFSTGACAAALCAAAWRCLSGETVSGAVVLRFPDGKDRSIPLLSVERISAACVRASLRKDAGDDPDCTHRAILSLALSILPGEIDKSLRPEDYILSVGDARVILRAAEGVGLCTRPGLDCEPGKWAINKGPRQMMAENLALAGLAQGNYLVELSVENGAELAKKTLNSHLGITGGISILGTTGLVRPFSHEAYVKSIRLCVRSHRMMGGDTMVFCTGGRTKSGAERVLPELEETAFVCIGDFIADSLQSAGEEGMTRAAVACMPGKLCKYAAGFRNTHAHKVSQDMELLRSELRRLMPGAESLHDSLASSVSVREALLALEGSRLLLLKQLAQIAREQFAGMAPGLPVRFLVFDFDGTLLFTTES